MIEISTTIQRDEKTNLRACFIYFLEKNTKKNNNNKLNRIKIWKQNFKTKLKKRF